MFYTQLYSIEMKTILAGLALFVHHYVNNGLYAITDLSVCVYLCMCVWMCGCRT